MKKSIMQKWVKALRSGKYKQGTGKLRQGDKYCCLGVLADIYGDRFVGSLGHPSKKVCEWAGVTKKPEDAWSFDTTIQLKNGSSSKHLVNLNDSGTADFKEIARIIEKNYKDL